MDISSPADFHVHLRQGSFSELIVPHVRRGGFHLAYVMASVELPVNDRRYSSQDQPNLKPPITTTDQALKYKAELERIDPSTEYLMTLYLSPDLTPGEVRKAKAAGIAGICARHLAIFFH